MDFELRRKLKLARGGCWAFGCCSGGMLYIYKMVGVKSADLHMQNYPHAKRSHSSPLRTAVSSPPTHSPCKSAAQLTALLDAVSPDPQLWFKGVLQTQVRHCLARNGAYDYRATKAPSWCYTTAFRVSSVAAQLFVRIACMHVQTWRPINTLAWSPTSSDRCGLVSPPRDHQAQSATSWRRHTNKLL
jgi:hypothetical protein